MLARNVGKNTHAPAPFAPGLKKDTGAGLTMAMERGAGIASWWVGTWRSPSYLHILIVSTFSEDMNHPFPQKLLNVAIADSKGTVRYSPD